jgi:hypothetical protein
MEVRDRRVAQIVRDFMLSYQLAADVGERLRRDELDFADVERLVGEGEESALHRLKEECHALFRFDGQRSQTELQADQLFDLAVGALFHEGMKFREGYYLTTVYAPRFERMVAEGSASGPLAESFRRVIAAGRRRTLEAHAETDELFRETRDHLLVLLRRLPESGAVARSLLEEPARSEAVFGVELDALLEDVYGSVLAAHRLAVCDLIKNGHFEEAAQLAARIAQRDPEYGEQVRSFSRALARYYAGDPAAALAGLDAWLERGARGEPEWRARACAVLEALASSAGAEAGHAERARGLIGQLTP